VSSGVRYAAPLTWIKTAHWDYRSYESFCELDGEYQSFLVAAYLTDMQAAAVEAQESSKSKK
jgi:hypothetical protein